MKIKNIFMTGGSGKIGRALLPELVKAGYQVTALEFDNEKIECKGVNIIKGDIRDPKLAPKALKNMDAVIHFANCKENRELFMETNIKGTFYLLDEAMRCGHIKQFIQAGSDARAGIYYYPRPFPIDETFPHAAYPGYYAFSKVLEETMCEQYRIQYGTPITVLRFSWVWDEDDAIAHMTLKEPNFGVPVWKELAKTKEQKMYFKKNRDAVAKLLKSDGTPGIRHVVGIKDVVQACLLAIGNPAAIGHAFTIAGPAPFSYDYAAKYLSKKLGLPVVEFICPEYHDFQHNIAKARSILGYNPVYDITKIIDDAVAFRQSGKQRTPIKYIG
ncbi:MAG: NAD(P)-dependent oxidoreductase [bacterium]|nr:NAD(P)-dependent oxidoreductase [bacterium]